MRLLSQNKQPLKDTHGRQVRYLRLSVTDRCNLRCKYCVREIPTFIPHPHILRYEEMESLVAQFRLLGVKKVRLTGGEPFVRKGFVDFLESLMQRYPDLDLRITTNATLLEPYVRRLADAGIRRLNISLDTLARDEFAEITGRDMFARVRRAIDRCLDNGINIKINAVAMHDVTESQVPNFLEFIRERPMDVRFIELMPIGSTANGIQQTFLPVSQLLTELRKHVTLVPLAQNPSVTSGPAKIYELPGYQGRIGVITPLSSHSCATCNRVRVTSDGQLRTCLYSDKTYQLRGILRHPKLGIEKVMEVIRLAGRSKPEGYKLLQQRAEGSSVCRTAMTSIGG